jgi:hypothetical protein
MMAFTARWVWEESELTTVSEQDSNLSSPVEGPELSQSEVAQFIEIGTLTEEAWERHLQGASWQIQVR